MHNKIVDHLLEHVTLEVPEGPADTSLEGKIFVITGSVTKFKNRNELKAYIEDRGGKVASSVSKNTNYLLTNDKESGSSKNLKAKELGTTILNEKDHFNVV